MAKGGRGGNKATQQREKSVDEMDAEELKQAIATGKLQRSKIEDDVQQFIDDAANNRIEELKKIIQEDKEKAEKLVNKHDANGRTALHFTCHNGNMQTFEMLQSIGADIDATDFSGYTPLMMAIKMSNTEIAQKLISLKCKVNTENKEGFTPLQLAIMNNQTALVKSLLDAGAQIKAEQKSTNGSVLHAACGSTSKDTLEIVKLLVEREPALLTTQDDNKMSPLHMACAYGNISLALELISLGANVNAVARDGITPLHICTDSENTVLIKALIDKGAMLKMDKDGETPLIMAKTKKNNDLITLLTGLKLDTKPYVDTDAKIGGPKQKRTQAQTDARASPEVLKENGNKAYRKGEYELALDWYQLALDIEEVSAEVKTSTGNINNSIAYLLYSNKSACHFALKRYEEALTDANKTVELAPKWSKGYLRLSQALEKLNRLDEAKVATDKMNELIELEKK